MTWNLTSFFGTTHGDWRTVLHCNNTWRADGIDHSAYSGWPVGPTMDLEAARIWASIQPRPIAASIKAKEA
jgi:hypothetical protein